jgi:predicted amidohydrolase YtcJ
MDRRIFFRSAAAGAAALTTLQLASCGGGGDDAELSTVPPPDTGTGPDMLLINGKIHTMDDLDSKIASIGIRQGRFVPAGEINRSAAKVIDLKGRTVVPGLIESHTHFISLANRPGYHVAEWELAADVTGVLQALKARRDRGVPQGQFITAMGAGAPNIFAERRLPTLAEIDSAVSDRPVFLYQGGGGPARTNTLGKQFFESVAGPFPVTVDAEGLLAGASGSTPSMANRALYHLRIRQTFEDKKRSALDAMAYSAAVGVTTNLDQVLQAKTTGTLNPSSLDPQPTDGLSTLDHYRMYDAYLALHAEKKAFVRLQMNFLHNQSFIPELGNSIEDQLPELRQRLKHTLPYFGDDMVMTGGIGEWGALFVAPGSTTNPRGYEVWYEAQRLIAKARWHNENAQQNNPNIESVIAAYEALDAEFGIKDLRWGMHHLDQATPAQFARLKALNVAASLSGFRWTSAPRTDGAPVGPLFKDALASGIRAALHQDGVHIAAHNPWFAMHYATTGLNLQGQQINPGQQITRTQAMRAFTREAAWFLKRENDLGSIETGKLADLVVLDRDYFTVPDAEMRQTRPILTVIDGKVVHDRGALG